MIRGMFGDVKVFLMLGALLIFGYGITAEVLLHPAAVPDAGKFAAVIYR